jgi:hypothetical protein
MRHKDCPALYLAAVDALGLLPVSMRLEFVLSVVLPEK